RRLNQARGRRPDSHGNQPPGHIAATQRDHDRAPHGAVNKITSKVIFAKNDRPAGTGRALGRRRELVTVMTTGSVERPYFVTRGDGKATGADELAQVPGRLGCGRPSEPGP